MKVIMPSTRCTCILMSRRQAAPECSPVALWSPGSTAAGIEAGLWLLDFDLSRCVDALWSIFFLFKHFHDIYLCGGWGQQMCALWPTF